MRRIEILKRVYSSFANKREIKSQFPFIPLAVKGLTTFLLRIISLEINKQQNSTLISWRCLSTKFPKSLIMSNLNIKNKNSAIDSVILRCLM